MKFSIPFFLVFFYCSLLEAEAQLPLLTKKEAKSGWTLLFDGKTFEGWQKANGKLFDGKGWKIENGVLSVDPSTGRGGDIVTTGEFSDFDFSIDFKLEKGSNSGIKYFVFKNTSLGCEYQLIDDGNHPDAKLGRDGNRTLAALYDVYPPYPGKIIKPIGEWNNAKIVAKGSKVEHWLNGKLVLKFDRNSKEFEDQVSKSKFRNDKGWAQTQPSPILLQEHQDVIHFRNIKIRRKTR